MGSSAKIKTTNNNIKYLKYTLLYSKIDNFSKHYKYCNSKFRYACNYQTTALSEKHKI
jgi:hypothetical protein